MRAKESFMRERLLKTSRVVVISAFLTMGAYGANSISAQESTVPVVDQATETVEDSGFDDWGLLGLLGLAGLAGLLKRPTREVRTVDRVERANDPLR
jgi:MYXO-CTERM domain-containing protein